jgi:hypothetical protein
MAAAASAAVAVLAAAAVWQTALHGIDGLAIGFRIGNHISTSSI